MKSGQDTTFFHGHTCELGSRLDATVLGILEANRPFALHRSKHPFWALDYVFSEGAMIRVGKAQWTERPPCVLHLYAPGVPYGEKPRPGVSRMHSAWIAVNGRKTGLEALVNPRTRWARFNDPWRVLEDVFHQAARDGYDCGDSSIRRAQIAYYRVLDILTDATRSEPGVYTIGGGTTESVKNRLVSRVEAFLADRVAGTIELKDIARAMNVSISTLSHTYSDQAGESPMKTLQRLRIKLARDLLLKGYSLKYIAEAAGFCNEYHLSNSFKRMEGKSPRDFLRSLDVSRA